MSMIVTGDDVNILVQLKKNGAAFAISELATISAALVDADHASLLIPATPQSAAAPGADWFRSMVCVQFSSAQSGAVTAYRPALLEIEVNDGGKTTWFVDVRVVKGLINV